MGSVFLVIIVVIFVLGLPFLPDKIKHSDQDKRREAFQKSIKEKRAEREKEK